MEPLAESDVAAPVYLRIALALRERIESGELAPDTLVPSERELAQAFGVSRMTARQALGVLESEGAVYRRPPRGTFVAQPRLSMRIGSFSDQVARMGHRPGAELVWAESQLPTRHAASALGLGEGALVHALQRLRRVEREPIAIETTYFPADLTPGLLDRDLDGSLWTILRRDYGVVPARASAKLEVVTLEQVASHRLGLHKAARGFLLTRRTFDENGRCFEFARDLYRADRVEFEIETAIEPPMT